MKLLMENWGEDFIERINEMLFSIEKGVLKPEFPVPENEEDLKHFLGIEKTSEEEKRQIRQKLRIIAQEDSSVYGSI